MKYCTECGAPLNDSAKFCGKCGTKQVVSFQNANTSRANTFSNTRDNIRFHSLTCPNCSGKLEVEDGLDTFFCKYCGYKILLTGQSEPVLKAKIASKALDTQVKLEQMRLEHDAKIQKERMKHGPDYTAKELALVIIATAILLLVVMIGVNSMK